MKDSHEALTITLHWLAGGREQSTTVVCEDSAPARLLPLMLAGCGLDAPGAGEAAGRYTLRLGAADGRALRHDGPISALGVRSGSHLWLTNRVLPTRRRCMVRLPDGSEATLPPRGLALNRRWLLDLLALLNPEAHLRELELLERRESPYAYVSKSTHCALAPGPGRSWLITTARSDVATLLNGARLFPEGAEPLADGDRLTLGAYGPTLEVCLGADEGGPPP